MKIPGWQSFWLRAALASAVMSLLVWAGFSLWGWREAGQIHSVLFDDGLKDMAQVIVTAYPRTVLTGLAVEEGKGAASRQSENFRLPDGESSMDLLLGFQVWTRDGRLISRSDRAPSEPLNPRFELGFSVTMVQGRLWRVYTARDADDLVRVQVGTNVEQRQAIVAEAASDTLTDLLWLLVPAVLALVLVGWWTASPLTRLQRDVDARAPDDASPLPARGLPSEVQPLVQAFNALLGRAAQARAAQQRFVADAAHELRTPMAALRLQAQVAQRATDADERALALQALIDGIDRNARVAEQLLQLARLDAHHAGPAVTRVPLDLTVVVNDALDSVRPLGERKGVHLQTEVPPLSVRSDRGLLTVIMRNLLDNAVRYSPPGGQVRITASKAGEDVELQVRDQGPGMSTAEIEQAVQPFVRFSTEETGTGLGLSIVTRAAALLEHPFSLVPNERAPGLRGTLRLGLFRSGG